MSKKRMNISNIQIFSTENKMAKRVNFKRGINIITSNQKNGNKVGKSLILKSIYHTLGAECFFDTTLDKKKLIFIVQFSINIENYTMLRFGKMFKLFDEDYNVLLKTDSATILAKKLYEIYSFEVLLPSRNDNKLVTAPPAFAYMLNYIDQDKMSGSNFESFANLRQFTNYKANLLYCHFGLFNKEYFDLKIQKENLSDDIKKQEKELELILGMLTKINTEIPNAIPENMETLNIELEKREHEYRSINSKLKKAKDELLKLRDNQVELDIFLESLKKQKRTENKELNYIISQNSCPTCLQDISDTLEIRMNKNINIEDISRTSLEIQDTFIENSKKIEKAENTYNEFLKKLDEYKVTLRETVENHDDLIQLQGYSILKTQLDQEWSSNDLKKNILDGRMKDVDKKLRNYSKKKKEVDSKYFQLMKQDSSNFGLAEIKDENIKKITSNLAALGSNKPIVTIIWYFNLLKLKKEFNPNAIEFPIVLDSPNHGELDDTKKEKLFEYIFKNVSEDVQCIISTLGFDENKYDEKPELNIIELTNDKYKLLNNSDYLENKDLLDKLIDEV